MSYGQKSVTSRQEPQITPGPNVFTSQALSLAAAAGQPFGGLSGVAEMPSINALVNQAAFSNMNVLAQAQRTQIMPQQQVAPQQSRSVVPADKSQRAFVGAVTKMAETYGFVDDDVFFQTTVIRGGMPRVGDKVMVEASFNPSMPFKWNALRIQLIQQEIQQKQPQHQQFLSNQQSYNGSNNTAQITQGCEEQRNCGQDKGRINRRSPLRQEKDTQGRRFSPARRSRSPLRHISPKRASPLRRHSNVTNPFEHNLLQNLSNNTFSPGIFGKKFEKNEVSSSFWTIEHLSAIVPADIDDSQDHGSSSNLDHDFEEKAQAAIDQFWSKKYVVPSPSIFQSPNCFSMICPRIGFSSSCSSTSNSSSTSPNFEFYPPSEVNGHPIHLSFSSDKTSEEAEEFVALENAFCSRDADNIIGDIDDIFIQRNSSSPNCCEKNTFPLSELNLSPIKPALLFLKDRQ